jgi:hypothetical protein
MLFALMAEKPVSITYFILLMCIPILLGRNGRKYSETDEV